MSYVPVSVYWCTRSSVVISTAKRIGALSAATSRPARIRGLFPVLADTRAATAMRSPGGQVPSAGRTGHGGGNETAPLARAPPRPQHSTAVAWRPRGRLSAAARQTASSTASAIE